MMNTPKIIGLTKENPPVTMQYKLNGDNLEMINECIR